MPRRLIIAIVATVTMGLSSVGSAQVSKTGLLAPNALRQHGLERAWHTQIEVDRGRGHVVHVQPYVSHSRSVTLFEASLGSRRYLVSEHDKDPFGNPLGVEGARKKSEEQVESLKLRYPGEADKIESKMIVSPEISLYATTSRGLIHAIDAETGATRWTANLGNANYPTTESAANDTHVAFVNGSTLYVVRATDGQFQWQKRLSGVPAAGPAMSEEYVFVPTVNGALESYTLADSKDPPWIYKSIGRAMTRPAVGLNSIAWPTDRGHMYVATTTTPRTIRYRLEARDTIVSTPAFLAPDRLICTSTDGYIYCLNPFRLASNITWQFSTGESISQAPTVIGELVYVITDSRRLYALQAGTGQFVEGWNGPVPGIKQLLAMSNDRLYLAGDIGRLVIMDRKNGERIAEIPTIEYDLFVLNTVNDRLYVGSRNGTLQCLREVGNRWPTFNVEVSDGARPKPKVIQKPAGADGAEAPEDPFGGGAKPKAGEEPPADPFGGPDAKPAGKPAGKPAVDDPFGGE